MQKIFNIAKRKRKPNIHHDGQTDDLGARLEVAKRAAFCHPATLSARPARLKTSSSDKTLPIAAGQSKGWPRCQGTKWDSGAPVLVGFQQDALLRHTSKCIPPTELSRLRECLQCGLRQQQSSTVFKIREGPTHRPPMISFCFLAFLMQRAALVAKGSKQSFAARYVSDRSAGQSCLSCRCYQSQQTDPFRRCCQTNSKQSLFTPKCRHLC